MECFRHVGRFSEIKDHRHVEQRNQGDQRQVVSSREERRNADSQFQPADGRRRKQSSQGLFEFRVAA